MASRTSTSSPTSTALQALHDELEILRTGQGIVTKVEKETWPDGRTTWASSTKLPLLDDQGHIVGTFGISQDITVQMLDAEALRAAKETAEAASRAKSTFLANMSHEIRTPLNAVIGMTELVLKSQLTQQQREYLSTVRDSGQALLTVINDILDFSKIEAEKLVLAQERFHIRESLGDTMKSFALLRHQQGLELACHIHPDVPCWLVGDYHRLRQVVVNLVNNAIKFTERGEVVVEAACESSDADGVTLHFTVSDTGIGIPLEKHELVFGMFEQADSSTTRRHGGTGLGLAIATRLVGLMGGKIWLESETGAAADSTSLSAWCAPRWNPPPMAKWTASRLACTACACLWSTTTPRTGEFSTTCSPVGGCCRQPSPRLTTRFSRCGRPTATGNPTRW